MRRLAPWLCAGLALFAAGTMAEYAWRGVRPQIPEIGRKELEPTLGQGVLLGILGGLRTVVADLTWIRSYVLWERRERAGCEALMRAACALDPHSRYFWENTGYTVGFDLCPLGDPQARRLRQGSGRDPGQALQGLCPTRHRDPGRGPRARQAHDASGAVRRPSSPRSN